MLISMGLMFRLVVDEVTPARPVAWVRRVDEVEPPQPNIRLVADEVTPAKPVAWVRRVDEVEPPQPNIRLVADEV